MKHCLVRSWNAVVFHLFLRLTLLSPRCLIRFQQSSFHCLTPGLSEGLQTDLQYSGLQSVVFVFWIVFSLLGRTTKASDTVVVAWQRWYFSCETAPGHSLSAFACLDQWVVAFCDVFSFYLILFCSSFGLNLHEITSPQPFLFSRTLSLAQILGLALLLTQPKGFQRSVLRYGLLFGLYVKAYFLPRSDVKLFHHVRRCIQL